MSMNDIEGLKRMYPEWFPPTMAIDIIIGILILSLIFITPYLYIRFLEKRLIALVALMEHRLIPFIEFKMRLKKIIDLIKYILGIRIFGNPWAKD